MRYEAKTDAPLSDSASQVGETGDEEDSEGEKDEGPFSLLEAPAYGPLTEALHAGAPPQDLRELANIHRLFSAFTQPPGPRDPLGLPLPPTRLGAAPLQEPRRREASIARRSLDKCTGTDDKGPGEARARGRSPGGPPQPPLPRELAAPRGTPPAPVRSPIEERNLFLFDASSNRGVLGGRGVLEGPREDPGHDSDCVSEDSECLAARQSKFSKFLCVGIGRTKTPSRSSSKGGPRAPGKGGAEGKKPLFKLRGGGGDPKAKNLSLKPQRSEDAPELPLQKPEGDPRSPPAPELGGDPRCPCRTPDGRHPPRLDLGKSSSSSSSKEWGSLASPDPPAGGGPKGGGQPLPMTTSGSLGTTQSLGESSGYESIPRDSECSSFSSSQESEMDEDPRKVPPQRGAAAPPQEAPPEVSRVEAIVHNSFLKHLTKRKTEAKVVSSTTWKYRCW